MGDWTIYREHQLEEMDDALRSFVAMLPLDTEMILQVVVFAQEHVTDKILPCFDYSDTNQPQADFLHADPITSAEVVDNPPSSGGCCLAIGMRVRIVGSHGEPGNLENRVGRLARLDKGRVQWWVWFPKFKDRALKTTLRSRCAKIPAHYLVPLQSEEAFEEFQQQVRLATQASQIDEDDRLLQASQEAYDAEEEEQLVRALMESLTIAEMRQGCDLDDAIRGHTNIKDSDSQVVLA